MTASARAAWWPAAAGWVPEWALALGQVPAQVLAQVPGREPVPVQARGPAQEPDPVLAQAQGPALARILRELATNRRLHRRSPRARCLTTK